MLTEKEIKSAFARAVEREEGNLNRFARRVGIVYPVLHKMKSGETSLLRMRVETLARMFPEMRVFFFREDYPNGGCVSVNGTNNGAIANGSMRVALSAPERAMTHGLPPCPPAPPPDAISRAALEAQILHADDFSDAERVKFLLFLKDKAK